MRDVTVEAAPFRADLAEGPEGASAVWATTDDGVRVRLTLWRPETTRATVFLFPGRTEFAEKYGRVARDLTAQGLAVLAIDWRGQGASDRMASDRKVGHVGRFRDYQHDVRALVDYATTLSLPKPWLLLAHSMGGCIGLRALIEGLPVESAVFSGPMWGICMAPYLRPVAATLPTAARIFRQGERYVPGGAPSNYVTDTGFEDNLLTTDPDHYDYLTRHAVEAPDYGLGGPSLHWLGEALTETRLLAKMRRPKTPVLTLMGSEEAVVDPQSVRRMHENWPSATLSVIDGGKHEMMMEAPKIRKAFFDQAFAHYAAVLD